MKTRFIAYDLRFGRPVIQTGSLGELHRILKEGEYPLPLMLLAESDTLTLWNWDMQRLAVAIDVYNVNRMLDGQKKM